MLLVNDKEEGIKKKKKYINKCKQLPVSYTHLDVYKRQV